MVEIRLADFNDPQLHKLVEAHHAYGAKHYPAESNHELGIEELAADNLQLFTAWLGDQCVGMLGFKPFGEAAAELKSMHVLESGRGQGVAAKLVKHVIALAKQQKNCRYLLGNRQSRRICRGAKSL